MKYIFQVRIKPGHTAEQYADAWMRASEIIQRAPGARGTRLHRAIGRPDTLLAIASWDTKDDRDAMEGAHDPAVQAIIAEAAEHCEIAVIGEFEEADWIVLPEA